MAKMAVGFGGLPVILPPWVLTTSTALGWSPAQGGRKEGRPPPSGRLGKNLPASRADHRQDARLHHLGQVRPLLDDGL